MEFLNNSLQNNSSFKRKPNGNASRSAQTYHSKDQIWIHVIIMFQFFSKQIMKKNFLAYF